MKVLLIFVFISNLAVATLAAAAYWLIPLVGEQKPVDILFMIGLLFWLASTLVRFGNRRFKADATSYEVVMNDPQHIMRTDHLATRLLIAGIPALASAIIVGSILY